MTDNDSVSRKAVISLIKYCETNLDRELSTGEKIDLVLDNLPFLNDEDVVQYFDVNRVVDPKTLPSKQRALMYEIYGYLSEDVEAYCGEGRGLESEELSDRLSSFIDHMNFTNSWTDI